MDINTTANNFFSYAASYSWILVAAGILYIGINLFLGEQGRERAKRQALPVIVGTVLIYGCVEIASLLITNLGF